MPTYIEVAGTAQGKWFESALQVGAQNTVLGQLCGGQNAPCLMGSIIARRAPEHRKCAARGVPTDIEVADTAQGKWFESALHVGAQDTVLDHLCGC